MTGVRSFDIKAYDNSLAAYADLGWGDDPRLTGLLNPPNLGVPTNTTITPYLAGNFDSYQQNYVAPAYAYINNAKFNLLTQTFAHEGRVPPLVEDNIFDAQYGAGSYPGYNYTGNIGDDNPAVVRLRRVWDSWSTEYTAGPGHGGEPRHLARRVLPGRSAVRAADLSVVPAALPGAAAGHPDPDPRDRPGQSTRQDIDHPTGFHG